MRTIANCNLSDDFFTTSKPCSQVSVTCHTPDSNSRSHGIERTITIDNRLAVMLWLSANTAAAAGCNSRETKLSVRRNMRVVEGEFARHVNRYCYHTLASAALWLALRDPLILHRG
eukprot:scaffold248384_cov67-Cyclotella_meneghiniana.AAC.1